MQFILPIIISKSYHLEDFIISASNQLAYNILINWQIQWGLNPFEKSLLLYGPSSSGKTYLAKIWQHISNACLLDLHKAFNENMVNNNHAFIIENIEQCPEEKLLHYFNVINEQGKHLLLTTGQLTCSYTLKDLSSRINSLLKIEIAPPDYDLMKILLFKHFSANSIKISPRILEFLIPKLPRNFAAILKIAEQINCFALENKRNITIPLIRQFLDTTGGR